MADTLTEGRLDIDATLTGRSTTGFLGRIMKYALVRAASILLMLAVGIFLAVLVINFGGFIDKIYEDRIAMTLFGMGAGMTGMDPTERIEILEETRVQLTEAYGLNQPFLARCVRWFFYAIKLDLSRTGLSAFGGGSSSEVRVLIMDRLSYTLLLAGSANLLLFFASLFIALNLSRKYASFADKLVVILSPISSVPSWIYGVLLVAIFAVELHWLPFGGMFDDVPPESEFGYVAVVLKHMILPVSAIVLSVIFQSVYAWRTLFLIHSREDYVELAEARGLEASTIRRSYILRPSLPYIVTNFALLLVGFWQGAIALELFFNWPGIGPLFIDAIWRANRPIVLGVLVMFAYLLGVTIFVIDIVYALVDPRVRVGGGERTLGRASSWNLFRWFRQIRSPLTRPIPPKERYKGDLRSPLRQRVNPLDWLKGLWRGLVNVKSALVEIRRYPAAAIGLVIILTFIAISIYTVVAIPAEQAELLWRQNREALYRNPRNAQPTWLNLFRKDDLPPSIIMDSRINSSIKMTDDLGDGITEVILSYAFDYPYADFPQDLAFYIDAQFDEKRPHITLLMKAPDGREIKLDTINLLSSKTYIANQDRKIDPPSALIDMNDQSIVRLFADPTANEITPQKGTWELRLEGYTFEQNADIDGEMVLHGKVFGWAGTDHMRRDLSVAMLWGMPVAMAFGLLGAVGTTLLSMTIAALGVWFGGLVDGLIQRITEVNMILPALPIAITVFFIYGKSVWVILGVMVLLNIFSSGLKNYRAVFLQVKQEPYIEAAQAYGTKDWRMIWYYMVPRITPVLVPQLVYLIPGYVFLEATLAYLGVSDIYLPTWGKVIQDALTLGAFKGVEYWYWVLEPLGLLMLTGLAFAMLGFSLDRIFNPRLRDT